MGINLSGQIGRLANLSTGDTFKMFGEEFIVLEKPVPIVFLVMPTQIVHTMPFREEDESYDYPPNDFQGSSIKTYINGDYLSGLREQAGWLPEGFAEDHEEDRTSYQTAMLAQFDDLVFKRRPMPLNCASQASQDLSYSYDGGKAALLTLEEYKKYKKIISALDTSEPWWLATPWDHVGKYKDLSYAHQVCYVGTDGKVKHCSCGTPLGVRPVLLVSGDTPVFYNSVDVLCRQLADFRKTAKREARAAREAAKNAELKKMSF